MELQAPDPDHGALPREISRYDVLGRLATGGMGEVLLARAKGPFGLEKLVVIKRTLREFAGEPDLRRQLLDEARIAVDLSHSNIVQTLDVGVDTDGTVFLVMEHLHGRDLRAIKARAAQSGGVMPLEHAVAIGIAVCAGLHYVHEKTDARGAPLGLVHRDVSPHNVFVKLDGAVKLIDFGIAKGSFGFDKTRFGMVKGKPGYMSPEQCRGEPVDRRSDVFATAILLYELTAGAAPFVARNAAEYFDAVLDSAPVPPSQRRAAFAPELERILLKGLERERRDRYPTALAMQRDLEAFAHREHMSLSPQALASYMEALFPEALEERHSVRDPQGSILGSAVADSSATPTRSPRSRHASPTRGETLEQAPRGDPTTAALREVVAASGPSATLLPTDTRLDGLDVPARTRSPGAALLLAAILAVGGVLAWVGLRASAPAAPRDQRETARAAPTAPPANAAPSEPELVPVAGSSASLSPPATAETARTRAGLRSRPPPPPASAPRAVPDLDSPLPR